MEKITVTSFASSIATDEIENYSAPREPVTLQIAAARSDKVGCQYVISKCLVFVAAKMQTRRIAVHKRRALECENLYMVTPITAGFLNSNRRKPD